VPATPPLSWQHDGYRTPWVESGAGQLSCHICDMVSHARSRGNGELEKRIRVVHNRFINIYIVYWNSNPSFVAKCNAR
jgi:hypothetical protein